MIITHKLQPMDLTAHGVPQRVDVMQDDKYSRNLQIGLYENGTSWEIPSDVVAVVRYKKSDGKGGNYNTLPDGTKAYEIAGNVLTVALAPQVCTTPGMVKLAVGLIRGNAEINTFSVDIDVQCNPGINVQSEDYFKISGFVPNAGWEPNMFLGTDADGAVVTRKSDEQLDLRSQGRSAKYTFTSPGWKRVLNIIRTSGGMVNFGISNAYPLYMSQSAGICFGGFVSYNGDTSHSGLPMLYQLYDNVFGSEYGTDNPVRITAVRIGYPDPDQEPYDNGTSSDARVNPINCYMDVKVEYDESVLGSGKISFNLNYAGFADSHNCVPITEETNANELGMYGESLIFHEFYLQDGAMLYVPGGKASLPGYVTVDDRTKAVGISGLTNGYYGFTTANAGSTIVPAMATNGEIEAGTNKYKPIVPSNLEYAVRYVGDNVYLEKPYTEPEVGKILKVLSVNEDGTFTCEWGDAPAAGVSDVKIGANSIVVDGVASFRVAQTYGTSVVSNNMLATYPAPDGNIAARDAKYMPITTTKIDYAVKAAMCDGKGAAWSDAERLAALLRIGCTVDENGFVKWTAQEA